MDPVAAARTGAPRTIAKAGEEGLAEVYVMPTQTAEGERAAVCIVVDVRTLRRIETDLAASQSIFGQSPFGFLLIDPDLRVRRANHRFASLFGGTPDDHRGKGVGDYLPRPEAERVAATLRRVLETGESITDMHVTGFLPGSDERRHWSVNLYRVRSGSGRPSVAGRVRSSGTWARRRAPVATLPRTSRASPPRPWVAMAMTSARCSAATLAMTRSGWPVATSNVVCCPWLVSFSAWACRYCRAAARSASSSNGM